EFAEEAGTDAETCADGVGQAAGGGGELFARTHRVNLEISKSDCAVASVGSNIKNAVTGKWSGARGERYGHIPAGGQASRRVVPEPPRRVAVTTVLLSVSRKVPNWSTTLTLG